MIFDLRMGIVRHMQSLSLSFFNRRKTGELMSHVTSDATLVHGVITQTIIQVLGQVLTLVGGVAVIFLMNWRLALLTLVVAPPIAILGQRMGRRIRDISREAQDAQGEAVGVLQEAIAEVRVVQAFTREEYEAERFHEKLLFMFRKSMERARITSVMRCRSTKWNCTFCRVVMCPQPREYSRAIRPSVSSCSGRSEP